MARDPRDPMQTFLVVLLVLLALFLASGAAWFIVHIVRGDNMASPIIDSIVATPASVLPGGAFVVTVAARDPDAQVAQLQATITDAGGNSVPGLVSITISDPITYELTGPVGFQIAQRAGQPGVFDCVAP